jgi:alpha-beta hydrolase superfamily lysophospholipase
MNLENEPSAEGVGRSAAIPVAIGAVAGLFQPEDATSTPREAAVLLLPPWGFEEMCTRKFYRILAEHLAASGMPSLRFDYPGTGDSAGSPADEHALSDWVDAAIAASRQLKALSQRPRIILLGQGIGAMIAQLAGNRIEAVDAIVMLAPALSGRAYLREVGLWSRVVDQGLGLREDQRDADGVSIAGLRMPRTIVDELRRTDIAKPVAVPRCLVLERAARLTDTRLPDALRALGTDVTLEAFDGYDELVLNPTFQKIPMAAVDRVVKWLAGGNRPVARPPAPGKSGAAEIAGPGYRERLVRFGSHDHVYGVICMPDRKTDTRSVLLLGTSYDRSAGWARAGVETARALATRGIASLRYDSANVGDSPPVIGDPQQVLYSETQKADARAAVDLMEAEFGSGIVVAGRCSGAYLALRAALADKRVAGVVSINPFVFYWDPSRSLDAELRFVPRSLEDYGQRFARLDTLKRLVSGKIDVAAAARNILIAAGRRLARAATPLMGLLPRAKGAGQEAIRTFDGFAARRIPVSLIYGDGDVGLDDLRRHFGESGSALRRYSNVRLTMLADTDHNITPPASRASVLEEIVRVARG